MIIQSNSPVLEKEIKNLISTLEKHGAWFHDQLALVDVDGSFSVQVHGSLNPNELMLKLPYKLLLPIEHLGLTVKGEEFHMNPDPERLSAAQIEVAKPVIEIFNLTNKVKIHREECLWIKYRDYPDLPNALLESRTVNQAVQKKHSYLNRFKDAMDDNEFMCWSFLQARVLGTDWDNGEKLSSIMPFVDYYNHDQNGCPYYIRGKGDAGRSMFIYNRQPYHYTCESFVKYGSYDAVDTLFNYGFPDMNSSFVRSVPLNVTIEGFGELKINAFAGSKPSQKLPKGLEPLRPVMPLVKRENDGLTISHVIIPIEERPHSMRRILQSTIRTLVGPEAPRETVVENVYMAEQKIMDANIKFYKDFISMAEGYDAPDDLKQPLIDVARGQLNKLYKYLYKPDFFKIQPANDSEDNEVVDCSDTDADSEGSIGEAVSE